MIQTSAFQIAQRFVGTKEIPGDKDNPFIVWCLDLVGFPSAHDETPWCSAFVNRIAWLLRLERSNSASARSWLKYGTPINLEDAVADCDIVILSRGDGPQPGPEIIQAPGHVGFYASHSGDRVSLLAGNQENSVSVASFPKSRILGIRRLA